MTGVRSCRKLETACRDQIPYLWLTGWQHPDHNTLWRFYKGHRHTIGISGVTVGPNLRSAGPPVVIFPLASLSKVDHNNLPGRRETIRVWALDAQRVANALPTLLPQLGIPIDAVGVVVQTFHDTGGLVEPVPGYIDISDTGVAADGSGPSQQLTSPRSWLWTIVGVCMGLGLLTLASIILVKVKKTRRAI